MQNSNNNGVDTLVKFNVTASNIFSVPWDSCTSSPCDNGGTCIDVNVDTFICTCRDGYFGVACGDSKYNFLKYVEIRMLCTYRPFEVFVIFVYFVMASKFKHKSIVKILFLP